MIYYRGPLAKVSSANLERSYRRAPKGPGEQDFGMGGPGTCHLCTCGMDLDWEDLPLKFYFATFFWGAAASFLILSCFHTKYV